ncbi:winged helix DNA-binding domain-containing protein [Labedaea rhizosphaerae]|uniref:Winged helix DNA-binding protein n=1 Tax=Labedaea rhizosphaerae TaxID=598644 RepID=A0A4R6RXI6_LABRH|nr:winged helix DNA-binding domain-containing protein [Labedaea rhizosphaerae]TDP91055.1 winged helix DNA-binding protein [Labedaea rhizosphaerae]
MAALTWTEVAGRRQARHGLLKPHGDLASAAAAMCGVHAQVMSAAEVSLGLRVAGVTRSDVRAAVHGSLVKTFGPRGTVHLLPAADLPLWTAALGAVPAAGSQAVGVRLAPEQLDAVVAAIGTALDGAALTITELDAVVVRSVGAWAGERTMPAFGGFWPRWRQAVEVAAHRGVLCFGPNRGRTITYTRPAPGDPVAPDAAVTELVRRYLRSYGPAAPEHFARWLAAPRTWASDRFAETELEPVTVEGVALWQLPGDGAVAEPAELSLLPYFDPYVVGGQPRELLFPGAAAKRALNRTGQAGNFPVVLAHGTVAGVWHLKRSGKRATVTVEPIGRFPALRRAAVEREAARIAAVVEASIESMDVVIGEVTVGPHA